MSWIDFTSADVTQGGASAVLAVLIVNASTTLDADDEIKDAYKLANSYQPLLPSNLQHSIRPFKEAPTHLLPEPRPNQSSNQQ